MRRVDFDTVAEEESCGAVSLYCMGTMIIDEATRSGCHAFAKSMESVLDGLLLDMPRKQRSEALRISYALALGAEEQAQPRLKLVYSRA